jgi:aminocarboxymuconate-semialdehyde decarboxylase
MCRLVFSGVLEKYPELKIITHHCGGMIPFYAARMAQFQDTDEMMRKGNTKQVLRKLPEEYFKQFYADTALGGNSPALMCAFEFFGADHMLFGTDLPYDHMNGARMTRYTINAVEEMKISEADRKKIYQENARHLLRLPV